MTAKLQPVILETYVWRKKLEQEYVRPGRIDRECKYWWFDGWDFVVNAALATMDSCHVSPGPDEAAVDPHIHTMFSHCSISCPESIIRRAARIGLGAIAIMDHHDVRGALDAMRCADALRAAGEIPEDFVVIPAAEINSTVGHVGALFIQEKIPGGMEVPDLVEAIHSAGGLAVAVHPYHSTGIGDAVFDAPFDAVEIECGSVFGRRLIRQNRELAQDPRLEHAAKLGSSDAHYIRAMASCYTIVRHVKELTLASLKQAILERRTEPRTSLPYNRLTRILGPVGKLK